MWKSSFCLVQWHLFYPDLRCSIPSKQSWRKCWGVPGAKIGDASVPESFISTQCFHIFWPFYPLYFIVVYNLLIISSNIIELLVILVSSMAEQFNLKVFELWGDVVQCYIYFNNFALKTVFSSIGCWKVGVGKMLGTENRLPRKEIYRHMSLFRVASFQDTISFR